MRARGWGIIVQVGALVGLISTAAAEPAPGSVDVKAVRSRAVVLQDAQGGTYVVFRADHGSDTWTSIVQSFHYPASKIHRDQALVDDPGAMYVFYGPSAKAVHQQLVVVASGDGTGRWKVSTWAPRVRTGTQLGSIDRDAKGTYRKVCGEDEATPLTELTGDKAQAVLDKAAFLTPAVLHFSYLLGRDDTGVYYYVDQIASYYGGKGYRVFVGRKGAMKQLPLTDVASDSAGDVFSTRTGYLRLVWDVVERTAHTTWIKGRTRTELITLDVDDNSAMIYKDLGIYGFLGTLCDNV